MRYRTLLICLALIALFGSCTQRAAKANPDHLATVNLIDRNGVAEAVKDPARLKQLSAVDFSQPQPYQKVLRVYQKDAQGNAKAVITSYHPNGELKQRLEAVNSRAKGLYQEWYPSGVKKISAQVVGGQADIGAAAQSTWLFDKLTQAWNENGEIEAEIPYEKGVLQGDARYYHNNGKTWKTLSYHKNLIQGPVEVFTSDGKLLSRTLYSNGKKHGEGMRFWPDETPAYKEHYNQGKLVSGVYFSRTGEEVSRIDHGNGYRAVFGKDKVLELHQYRSGVEEGEVRLLDEAGETESVFHVQNGIKHGEETLYYRTGSAAGQVKLSMQWVSGRLHGEVKSWYPNGRLESRRELSNNLKQGLSSAWYENGSLMLIEEYEADRLVRGEYRPKDSAVPISRVIDGKGIATIYDKQGNLLRKTSYEEGLPIP